MCDTAKGEQDMSHPDGGPSGKVDGKDPRIMSWRVQRVREGVAPLPDVLTTVVLEVDAIEKVGSRLVNPGFGDEATHFERVQIVVEVVDDEI